MYTKNVINAQGLNLKHLPFIADTKGKAFPARNFWNVRPTGNWGADNAIGQHYARLTHQYMYENDMAPLLGWIVIDMKKKTSGIEIGFMSYFANKVMTCAV